MSKKILISNSLPDESRVLIPAGFEVDYNPSDLPWTKRELISQLEGGSPEEELFDAKVKVLGEYVKHHVKEEQNEIFPKVKKTKLDTRQLGEELMRRKQELKGSGM